MGLVYLISAIALAPAALWLWRVLAKLTLDVRMQYRRWVLLAAGVMALGYAIVWVLYGRLPQERAAWGVLLLTPFLGYQVVTRRHVPWLDEIGVLVAVLAATAVTTLFAAR